MSYLDYAERGLNAGWRYVLALVTGCVLTVALYGLMVWAGPRFGLRL